MTPGAMVGYMSLIITAGATVAGYLLIRWVDAWDSIGKGRFAIDPDLPQRRPLELVSPVDPAIQAAEARQMIEAKSYRRRQRGEARMCRGEASLDVDAEIERQLSDFIGCE